MLLHRSKQVILILLVGFTLEPPLMTDCSHIGFFLINYQTVFFFIIIINVITLHFIVKKKKLNMHLNTTYFTKNNKKLLFMLKSTVHMSNCIVHDVRSTKCASQTHPKTIFLTLNIFYFILYLTLQVRIIHILVGSRIIEDLS